MLGIVLSILNYYPWSKNKMCAPTCLTLYLCTIQSFSVYVHKCRSYKNKECTHTLQKWSVWMYVHSLLESLFWKCVFPPTSPTLHGLWGETTEGWKKTSKIFKYNHPPNTAMSAKPYPKVPHLHVFFNTSRDHDSTTSLASLFQCLNTLPIKKFFLISNLNLPWHNLRPLSLVHHLGEETKTHLTTSSFQVVVESNKVPPVPSSSSD